MHLHQEDAAFHDAVEGLRKLAATGSALEALLEFARDHVAAPGSVMLALVAFREAFALSIATTTSLGRWSGWSAPNPGLCAEELEADPDLRELILQLHAQ